MAISAKTPPISYTPNLCLYKLNNLRTQTFARIISRKQQFSLKKGCPNSLLNSGSPSFAADPNSYLTRLCVENQLNEAMVFLNSVGKELLNEVKEETFVSLVRMCEFRRAEDEGWAVYSMVSSWMTCLSLKLGNAFLSMFVRLRNLTDAWYVFGKMRERDVFSWNVLIGGYAKNGFFQEAIELYARMLWVGGIDIKPDVYTFPCVLRASGGLGVCEWCREIHAHVLRFGYEADIDVVNALITMYAKCGDVGSAREVFDGMSRRDVISWNAIISGYFENGECLDGLSLFFSMRECWFHPDLMTMTSVISAIGAICDESLGTQVHGYVAKMEYACDDSVYNALIQMYSSHGRWGEAEKAFARVESKDVVSWTSMISGYNNNGMAEKAVEAYKLMEIEGVIPDEITIACVLSACASLGALDIGVKLHELAERMDLLGDVIVANALIDFYSKCKCIDKALQVFHRMAGKNVISWTSIILGLRMSNRNFESLIYFRQMRLRLSPNDVTLVSVLSACGRLGALMRGKEIHAHVLRNGSGFDGFIPNALLDMYVRCDRMMLSMNQFRIQKPDVSSWNILLSGHAQRGRGELAIELFNEMIGSRVEPDEITFIALLCACSRSGMVAQGLQYFNSMETEYRVPPNLRHYACVVDLLGRAGKLEEAYELVEKMDRKPDAAVWGALLNACRIHRQVELGELAAKRIFEMDSRSVGYYILLCNLYSECAKWDEVSRLRKRMRDLGLIIDPGCSWVEVKGKIHAFLSGDDSHPRIRETSSVLQGLYERMQAEGIEDPEGSYENDVEASKAEVFCGHSERLAVAFGLMNSLPGMPIWVTKNLYMCRRCHITMKFISKMSRREICVRDTEHLHRFKDGFCSCGGEGYGEHFGNEVTL